MSKISQPWHFEIALAVYHWAKNDERIVLRFINALCLTHDRILLVETRDFRECRDSIDSGEFRKSRYYGRYRDSMDSK